ncbi:MAG: hypothetical protein AB8B72_11555 [Crocinitomicaceae bacterium]
MYSKKEDFLNQLQFELGHRWPELEVNSVETIEDIAGFVLKKNKSSNWPFLRFLPFYFSLKNWLALKTGKNISSEFDLNSLSKPDKIKLAEYTENKFGKPIEFRRPSTLKKIIFLVPLILVFVPLLVSTYLITSKDYSGWLYISALAGLLLTLALFKVTEGLKNNFDPSSLLDYAKSFYVIHNQKMTEEATKTEVINYLCASAEQFYKQPFEPNSQIP